MIEGSWLHRLGRRGPRGLVARGRGGLLSRDGEDRRIRISLPSVRVVLALVAVLALLGGAWLWLRDSSLVAVKRVTVTGATGPDAGQIRAALRSAARNMTTLDVQMKTLNLAVAPYPIVKGLQVSTQFPHGIKIHVLEEVPVGAILFDGRRIAVAGDGTLLHDIRAGALLPNIPMRVLPGGSRVSDPEASQAVAVLAAAPSALLDRVSEVITTSAHGVVAQLRNGPSVYFGTTSRLASKWAAAAAVLANPGSDGALYVDVTDPGRPAAGSSSSSGISSSSASGSGGSASASAGTSSTSASGGSASTGGASTSSTGGG